MKQLSGQDNSFLEIEGIGIPQHISSVAIYDQSTSPDGAVRFKDVLSHLKSRLHLSPIKDSLEGATINDVMLTIVTGALHKYLKTEGELPLESLTCGCPIDIRATAAMGVNATPYNTMLTNVPGPPNQLYFAGAQIVEGFGIGPLVPGVGLFHTASSSVMNKEGKINFSFWACRDMLPNPDFYKQCIEETYAELKAVTLAGKAKPKVKAKPKAKAKARKPRGTKAA